MYELFKKKAEAAGNTEVYRFGTRAEALECIVQILQREAVADAPGSYAVWADSPFLEGFDRRDLAAKVPGLTFDVTREASKQAKVGITHMEWGIADTGTLAQDSTRAADRLASALPWFHVMILPTGNIVADLASLMEKLDPARSNYIALITGPSKTADIERVLAIGVHGPEKVAIVCVDEAGGKN